MQVWTKRLIGFIAAGSIGLGALAASGWAQVAADPNPAQPPEPPTPPVFVVPQQNPALQLQLQAKRLAEAAQVAATDPNALSHVRAALAGDGQHAFTFTTRAARKEKAAFLGVVAVPADGALRAQLKLPRGIGLVIQQVTEQSPADHAGIQEHDIILKLDDQWLVNPQQLGVVVRMHKAGDEVTLTVVRQGQQQTIKAKLEEKEMVIPENNEPGWQGGEITIPDIAVPAVPGIPGAITMMDNDDADLIIKDDDHTLKIKVKNNEKHLVATDDDGQVLFDGPITTEDQRKAVPAEIAEKLEKYKDKIEELKESKPGEQRKIRIIRDGR